MDDRTPLCCCEYIDRNNERSHVLACCCNCVEIDLCCDRLLTCRGVSKKEYSAAMLSFLDRFRCPWRGGATLVSVDMVLPVVLQPLIVLSLVTIKTVIPFVVSVLLFLLILSKHSARHNSPSRFLYYWTVSSVTYIIIVFEHSVVPLSEISVGENLIIILLVTVSVLFFFLTKRQATMDRVGESSNGAMSNGASESVCPVCRVKVYPRHVHCHICQVCVPRYDYHCFWLDCCLGEYNLHSFMMALLFGMAALGYASLLILTTICRPVFKYGVLVPDDCTDVVEDTEMCVCYITAVYCMLLTFYLLTKALYHFWLISKGFSAPEWQQTHYSICASSPYSRGCCSNWYYLIQSICRFRPR